MTTYIVFRAPNLCIALNDFYTMLEEEPSDTNWDLIFDNISRRLGPFDIVEVDHG